MSGKTAVLHSSRSLMRKLSDMLIFGIRLVTVLLSIVAVSAHGATLYVGVASTSITPDGPVALSGQMHTRVATEVETPVMANVLVIEAREGDVVVDQAVFVACGLVAIRGGIREMVRESAGGRIPAIDPAKIVLSATHSHTAPVMLDGVYYIPEGVMSPAAFRDFFTKQVVDAIEVAWNSRQRAKVGWGMAHAVVGHNRRMIYEDGTAVMHGKKEIPTFRGFEGPDDTGVEVLFFWDEADKLIATSFSLGCPAQRAGSGSKVNADFMHPVREALKAKHGDDLVVLGWISTAGDHTPHLQIRKAAEARMNAFRGLDEIGEIARRIVNAWEEAYDGARQEKFEDVPFVHQVACVELPERIVTEDEKNDALAQADKYREDPKLSRRVYWHEAVAKRFERQQRGEIVPYKLDLHTLRLGDIAIATNDFELFVQYGIQMKAKSPALQTFLIQLCGPGTYVPTPIAEAGGGYSAIVQSNEVGSEGGQVLTDETVAAVRALWREGEQN